MTGDNRNADLLLQTLAAANIQFAATTSLFFSAAKKLWQFRSDGTDSAAAELLSVSAATTVGSCKREDSRLFDTAGRFGSSSFASSFATAKMGGDVVVAKEGSQSRLYQVFGWGQNLVCLNKISTWLQNRLWCPNDPRG